MKIYLSEYEYTILKYKFFEIIWQHGKPQDWVTISTKYLQLNYEIFSKKYRKSWEFSVGLGYSSYGKYLFFRLNLFWWCFEIRLGKNKEYPFKEFITGEEN